MNRFVTSIVCVVAATSFVCAQDSPEPITRQAYRQAVYEFEKSALAEGSPEGEAARTYVESAARVYAGIDSIASVRERFASGELTEFAHPDAAALLILATNPWDDGALERCESAFDRMKDAGVHPARLAAHAVAWADRAREIGDDESQTRAARHAVEQGIAAAKRPSNGWAARRQLYDAVFARLDPALPPEAREALGARFDEEGVDPWLAEMMRAGLAAMRGWAARGSRFANETTDEQFHRFRREMNEARGHYARALEIDPRCPEPAALMMMVVTAAGSDDGSGEYDWFLRAVAIDPGYSKAYRQLRFGMTPRWGGSVELLSRVAEIMANEGPPDSDVPYHALETFGTLMEDSVTTGGAAHDAFGYRDAVEALIVLAQRPGLRLPEDGVEPSAEGERYRLSALAYLAWYADHPELARDALRELDGAFSERLVDDWRIRGEDLEALAMPVLSRTPSISGAVDSEAAGVWNIAVEHWTDALTQAGDDTVLARALRHRLAAATHRRDFESGAWVEIAFDDDLSGLCTSTGRWHRVDERTVAGASNDEEFTALLAMRPGERFVFECDVKTPDASSPWSGAGVTFSSGTWRTTNFDVWRTLTFRPKWNNYAVGSFWFARGGGVPVEAPDDGWRRLRVVRDGERARCTVAGVEIRDGRLPMYDPRNEPLDQQVGIGGWDVTGPDPVLFRNLRIRRLKDGELPSDEPIDF